MRVESLSGYVNNFRFMRSEILFEESLHFMAVIELNRNAKNDVFNPKSVLGILSIRFWSCETETLLN